MAEFQPSGVTNDERILYHIFFVKLQPRLVSPVDWSKSRSVLQTSKPPQTWHLRP